VPPGSRNNWPPRQAVFRTTGTLTEGSVQVEGAYDYAGQNSERVLQLAALNAALQTGLANPLDAALLQTHAPDLTGARKLGEIPFDFVRKRLSVIVQDATGAHLITKGAFDRVLEVCSQTTDGARLGPQEIATLRRRYQEWSSQGIRVIAVAVRAIDTLPTYKRDDERDMTFTGFVTSAKGPLFRWADTNLTGRIR